MASEGRVDMIRFQEAIWPPRNTVGRSGGGGQMGKMDLKEADQEYWKFQALYTEASKGHSYRKQRRKMCFLILRGNTTGMYFE